MKRIHVVLAAFLWASAPARALDADYQRGFEDGYRRGYAAAQQELRSSGENRYRSQDGGTRHRGVVVARAWYGSDGRSCDLTGPMASSLNGRVSGQVPVSNQLCGDPSPGQRKSLVVEFYCGGEYKRAEANEHRTLYLGCDN